MFKQFSKAMIVSRQVSRQNSVTNLEVFSEQDLYDLKKEEEI